MDLGTADYRPTWEYQHSLFDSMVERKRQGLNIEEEFLLLVEHNPVYTLGKHGHAENLLFAAPERNGVKAECIRIERGGDITFHGPGQLVAYPIIDLERHHLGVKDYVWTLEETVIRTIAHYGIRGERVDGASGVWIDAATPRERKICALGVKCTRFVTMHGLALNVNTDLGWFGLINPCGFVDKGVTSIERELGHIVDISEVKATLAQEFLQLLDERTKAYGSN